jgi:hypothetical protein
LSNRRCGPLWAITSYFNPLNYRSRRENYRVFRENLSVPLVTVELSFDREFQLDKSDAEILIQIRGGDVMWQKERLLNIALQSIPRDCRAIAWVDCDVVFDSPDWSDHALQALDGHALIHLYEEIYNLLRDGTLECARSAHPQPTSRSIVYKMRSGEMTLADLVGGFQVPFGATCGQAWASPRSVLEKHGFYDSCIIGSADRASLCAAWGEFRAAIDYLRMSSRRAEHFLAWAKPYFETVRGQIGFIPGRVFHLWHGELENRLYAARHANLEPFDFDPKLDIAIDSTGCWRWSSDKREMHALVQRYFAARDEDGVGEEAARNSNALKLASSP